MFGALEQVVAEEEAAQRMLHAAAHLDEVLEYGLARVLLDLDVDGADGDEQVEARYDRRRVLHQLVQIVALHALLELVHHERLQVSQLVRHFYICVHRENRENMFCHSFGNE